MGGYAGTPLARKLGIGEGCTVLVKRPPSDHPELVAPLPTSVVFAQRIASAADSVPCLVVDRATLRRELCHLRKRGLR